MDLLVAKARQNEVGTERARNRLGAVIMETMGVGEVLGATLALQSAAGVFAQLPSRDARGFQTFAKTPTQTILPRVTLTEAVEDMIKRAPVTIRNAAERTAVNIARLYGVDSGGVAQVAFVRSAEQAVTERVQALIADAMRQGIAEGDTGREIVLAVDDIRRETAAWTDGYARMAFRTNVNTAVTAGRFRQAQDPDIRAVLPAFMFSTARDVDVRHNHRAHGAVFRVDNPVWNRIAPPLGYNCRCRVDMITLPMLRRMGKINHDGSVRESSLPRGVGPDDGFRHGGRPDLFVEAVMA
jgi:SPP1 gp7 family putative phage head morphogenesis protein